MDMQTTGQPVDLTLQDMQNYFGWPPPPPPPPQKKRWYVKTSIWLPVVYFFFVLPVCGCISTSSPGSAYTFAFLTLALLITEIALLAYMGVKKQRIAAAPLPLAPTDQAYEAWVRSWQNPIREYGMQKLGLD